MSACCMFAIQLLFQLTRTLGTRVIAKEHIVLTMIVTAMIQVLWLSTTAMGVHAVLNADLSMLTGYMLGGLLGTYIAMKIDFESLICKLKLN